MLDVRKSSCLSSRGLRKGRLQSLSKGLGATAKPASANTRIHARSSAAPRRCTRPVRMQEALWSPLVSTHLPQLVPSHACDVIGRRTWRRLRSATWNSSGVSLKSGDTGTADSHVPAKRPDDERSMAFALGRSRGST